MEVLGKLTSSIFVLLYLFLLLLDFNISLTALTASWNLTELVWFYLNINEYANELFLFVALASLALVVHTYVFVS